MSSTTTEPNSNKTSKFGLYTTLGISSLAIGFSIAAIPFLTPALRKHALPYIPATPKQIKNVFKAIRTYSQQNKITDTQVSNSRQVKLIDLGSGDGRIVFEAASRGFISTGVELNAVLVFYSKLKSFTNWQTAAAYKDESVKIVRPKFKRANFWNIKMSEYDLIVVFGVQEMMKDLAVKLKSEMKDNTLIVSCRNPIPNYKSVFLLDDELDSVWIYNKDSLQKKQKTSEAYTTKDDKRKSQDDDEDDDQI